jgi:hypothetical protein
MGLNNLQTGGTGGISPGGLRNLTEIGAAIPASGRLHFFDFRDDASLQTSGSTITGIEDQDTSEVLDTGQATGTTDINGVQAGNFDGTDDSLRSSLPTAKTQPLDVHVVCQINSVPSSGQERFFGGSGGTFFEILFNGDIDDYVTFAGSAVSGGSLTSDPIVITGTFNTTSSDIVVNGTEVVTGGDVGTNDLVGITLGADGGSPPGRHFGGAIGTAAVYDATASGYSRSDAHSAFADAYGISV